VPLLTVFAEQLFARVPGGTGRYARELSRALATTAPPGWRVRTSTAWHLDVESARVPAVEGPIRQLAGYRLLTAAWLHGLPPWPAGDSVHATTPLAPSRKSLRPLGFRPVVVTVHDTVPWTHPEMLTERGVQWHKTMIGRAAHSADALVVPTRAVADELIELFPFAGSRIRAIPMGVTPLFVPNDAAPRGIARTLPDRYVLSIATAEPRKGLDVLIRAMAAIPDVALVLVGPKGWGDVDPRRLAADAGLASGRLFQLGRLDDEDLADVLSRAAVLAVPSRAEGFGLPVIEGFAAGVPVVCSDAPALVEVAGDAALVVPREDDVALAEALMSLLSSPALASKLAERGRRRAGLFTWEASARSHWELHMSLR
jgi:glycosyltransferase involved in cell wall biosynthesis